MKTAAYEEEFEDQCRSFSPDTSDSAQSAHLFILNVGTDILNVLYSRLALCKFPLST